MFAKSLADLEVRSQLVWQNKGESSLQRAVIARKEEQPKAPWGLVLGLSSLEGSLILST